MYCLSLAKNIGPELFNIIEDYKLAELRLDLDDYDNETIKKLCQTKTEIICTYRKNTQVDDNTRLKKLLDYISFGASWIDLDMNNDEAFINKIRETLKSQDTCRLIISFHDYEKTPTNLEFYENILKAAEMGANLIKIVATSHGHRDNQRILNLNQISEKVLAFNMGVKGQITRALCLDYGAPFTYVCLNNDKTADGQLTKKELIELLNKFRAK